MLVGEIHAALFIITSFHGSMAPHGTWKWIGSTPEISAGGIAWMQ